MATSCSWWRLTSSNRLTVFRRGVLLVNGAPKDAYGYLDSAGLTKGHIWVNDHNLGMYWENTSPQHALYCPAPFLKNGENEVIILRPPRRRQQPRRALGGVAEVGNARYSPPASADFTGAR